MINRAKLMENLLQNMSAMRHKLMVGYTAKKKMLITPSQACVLRFVAENSSANVKAIAEALNITSSGATQLITGLVNKGYLIRRVDPEDRRTSSLSLSPKANKLFKEFKAQGLKKMTALFNALTDEELDEYATLTEKIANSLTSKS